jgi:hypothetical protein
MSPGELDPVVVRRHLLALDQAVQILHRHQGRPIDLLRIDREERWIVERGLQLCVQNALDIATHIAASAGRDVRRCRALSSIKLWAVLGSSFMVLGPVRGSRSLAKQPTKDEGPGPRPGAKDYGQRTAATRTFKAVQAVAPGSASTCG